MTNKYDAIVVLSADNETTAPRLDRALELYYQGFSDNFVLNGFNSRKAHDPGFEGDLYDDSRLKNYTDDVEQIHPFVLYAHNTEANVYEIKNLAREQGWKKLAVVSSETHIPRVKRLFHKFFPDYLDISFYKASEPTEKLRKRRVVKEKIDDIITCLELQGLPRGNGAVTDEKIYDITVERKNQFEKINNLIKKILKSD